MEVESVPFTNNQGAAEDLRLLLLYGGGEDLLSDSQLPVNLP
jgi:hypothetical protein